MPRMVGVAFLSALLLGLLVTVPSALAQRSRHSGGFGGGHSGGFSGHSFGSGFSGGSFGRPSGFAPRSFTSAPRFTSTAPRRAFVPGFRSPNSVPSTAGRRDGRDDHRGDRDDHRYRSPYRGYGGYPYLYANSWQLLPWDLGYSDFTGYNDYDSAADAQQPAASVAPPDDGYRPDYEGPADQAYQIAPPPADNRYDPNSAATEPELTLIFNDGRREAIHNYVLTAEAVIVLDQAATGHQQRIPLASLDLPATEGAAQQAGLDFSPPA